MREARYQFWGLSAAVSTVVLLVGLSTSSQAAISNGGFETGGGLSVADNASFWNWTPDANGERVNALVNTNLNNGDGTLGVHLIDPLAGSWFGYAENNSAAPGTDISQSVLIDSGNPVLTFWWRFFTQETPDTENTFNDRFHVSVEGSSTIDQTVANVNGTSMITTDGPLWTPTGTPGLNQSFDRYTAGWAFYSLDASALAGETVTVYFRVNDVGGPHNQSSGFALDQIEFVPLPEPASISMALVAGLVLWRRRQ